MAAKLSVKCQRTPCLKWVHELDCTSKVIIAFLGGSLGSETLLIPNEMNECTLC